MNSFPSDSNPFLEKKDKPASSKNQNTAVFSQGLEMTTDGAKAGYNASAAGANAAGNTTAGTHIKDGANTGATYIKDAGVSGYNAASSAGQVGAGYAMDAAKVMKLDEAKAMMNPEFTKYMTMDYDKFMDIIPIDYYGPVEKLLLTFFLYLPAFFSFYTLKMFHDSIYTMVVASFIFIGLTFFHFRMMDEKVWYFIALKNFTHDYKQKLNAAIFAGLGAGVALAVILILWFSYIPFGPKAIYLQMPYFQNWWDVVYWAFFTLFFIGILPAAESVFYFVFQNNIWFKSSAKINIALAFALFHFGWICEVIDNWWAIIILTVIAFVVGLVCLSVSGRDNIFRGITLRVGFSVSVYALLLWLYFMHPRGKLATPAIFLRGSGNNMFMKK